VPEKHNPDSLPSTLVGVTKTRTPYEAGYNVTPWACHNTKPGLAAAGKNKTQPA